MNGSIESFSFGSIERSREWLGDASSGLVIRKPPRAPDKLRSLFILRINCGQVNGKMRQTSEILKDMIIEEVEVAVQCQ